MNTIAILCVSIFSIICLCGCFFANDCEEKNNRDKYEVKQTVKTFNKIKAGDLLFTIKYTKNDYHYCDYRVTNVEYIHDSGKVVGMEIIIRNTNGKFLGKENCIKLYGEECFKTSYLDYYTTQSEMFKGNMDKLEAIAEKNRQKSMLEEQFRAA